MAELNFQIDEVYGVLSENRDGWRKELTLIRWNNRAPKFDVRSWEPNYEAMTKGITFTKNELIKLREVLNTMELEPEPEPEPKPKRKSTSRKKKAVDPNDTVVPQENEEKAE